MLRTGFVLLFVAGLGLCHGGTFVVGQFEGMKTELVAGPEGVFEWRSAQGMVMYGRNGDWQQEGTKEGKGLRSLRGVEGMGLWFDRENGAEIFGMLMVVEAEELRVREALFTGERTVRLANRPAGGEEGKWDGVGPANGVRIWVNGVEGGALETGKRQIVTAVFPEAVALWNSVVGNDPGLLAWRRGFSGKIHEAVLLGGGAPAEKALRGMESALALRWKVAEVSATKEDERKAAQSVPGFSAHGVWGTLFMVR